MSHQPPQRDSRRRKNSSGLKVHLALALVIVGFSIISYLRRTQVNEVTGQHQRVSISQREEISLGLSEIILKKFPIGVLKGLR